MSGAYDIYDEICNDYCMCSDDESDEPVVSDCVNDEAYDWSGKGYVWNEEAFNSAARIYRIMTGETPDYLPRYNFTFNDYHYYFHDYDYKVKHSGKSVIALCKESPRDKFYYTHLGHKLYWIYNSHDGAEDYVLYKLKQYGEHKLDDIFWCKKFGYLKKYSNNKYKILTVYLDPIRRPGEHVAPYMNHKYVNLKIYPSQVDKKNLIKQ